MSNLIKPRVLSYLQQTHAVPRVAPQDASDEVLGKVTDLILIRSIKAQVDVANVPVDAVRIVLRCVSAIVLIAATIWVER